MEGVAEGEGEGGGVEGDGREGGGGGGDEGVGVGDGGRSIVEVLILSERPLFVIIFLDRFG